MENWQRLVYFIAWKPLYKPQKLQYFAKLVFLHGIKVAGKLIWTAKCKKFEN